MPGRQATMRQRDRAAPSAVERAGEEDEPGERRKPSLAQLLRETRDAVDAKYRRALANGHTVAPLLHCTFGGMESETAAQLQLLHNSVKGQLDDPEHAPWTARSFLQLHAQRISTAVQLEAARQVRAAVTGCWSAA